MTSQNVNSIDVGNQKDIQTVLLNLAERTYGDDVALLTLRIKRLEEVVTKTCEAIDYILNKQIDLSIDEQYGDLS